MDFKSYLIETIQEFRNAPVALDWQAIFEDQDAPEVLYDAIETIITSLTYSDIENTIKEPLIGRLSMVRVILMVSAEQRQEVQFEQAGLQLETLLREVLRAGSWLTQAQELFEGYQELETAIEQGNEPTIEAINYFRPVFCALAFLTIVTLDQPSE